MSDPQEYLGKFVYIHDLAWDHLGPWFGLCVGVGDSLGHDDNCLLRVSWWVYPDTRKTITLHQEINNSWFKSGTAQISSTIPAKLILDSQQKE